MTRKPWPVSFELATFSPADAERVTGLTTGMQRDWRQRGYIPKTDKRARFDAFALAEIWVMKLFAERGIGPALSQSVAPKCAESIVHNALQFSDADAAFAGQHLQTFDWLDSNDRAGVHWRKENGAAYAKRPLSARTPLESLVPQIEWNAQRTWLIDKLFKSLGRFGQGHGDVIWWPTGEVQFSGLSSFDNRGAAPHADRYAGAFVGLDLYSLAEILVERAGRPLVKVTFR